MNPELQKALADVVELLKQGAQAAATTAQTELPLLVREYLTWGAVDAGVWAAACLGVALTAAREFKYNRNAPKDRHGDIKEGNFVACIAACLIGTIAAVISFFNFLTLGKILLAPRVYLLEQLAAMVK